MKAALLALKRVREALSLMLAQDRIAIPRGEVKRVLAQLDRAISAVRLATK